jgi:signal transduction histidine kinase
LAGELYIDSRIPASIKTDSHFFKKILMNMILNGIKFTNSGAVMTAISWVECEEDTP